MKNDVWSLACALSLSMTVATTAVSLAQSADAGRQAEIEKSNLAIGSLSRFSKVPVVQARVGGRMRFLAIRTCTYTTILDPALCKELDLKPRSQNNLRNGDTYFDPPEFRLGETLVDWISAVRSLDCQYLSNDLGVEISGAIGMEMLSKLVLRIDPDEDLVALAQNITSYEEKWEKSGLAIARGNVPVVLINLPGRMAEVFRVDTSLNCNGTLSKQVFDSLKQLDRSIASGESAYISGIKEGQDISFGAMISGISVWATRPRPLHFRVEDENKLGIDFLLRYRLSIDFRNSHVYSTPSALFSAVDGHGQYGIKFQADTGMTEVHSVEPGSVSHKAGIRAGDKVVSVEGHSVETQLFRSYRAMCAPCESDKTIVCSRNGNRFEILIRGAK